MSGRGFRRRRNLVVLEAPLVAAGGLEGGLVAAGARRVAHGRGGRELVRRLVPPDGSAARLRVDLLGMAMEVLLHEPRSVGHGCFPVSRPAGDEIERSLQESIHERFSKATHGRFSGPV